jgi:hypothetical protein
LTKTISFARRALRGGTALQALALLGAGVGTVAMAAPAAAQDYNNINATGRVQGTNGQPIAGATVTVTSDAQGFTRTVTAGSDGSFRVATIPQGSYTFEISAEGFDTYTESGIALSQSSASNQFTLAPVGSAGSGDIVITAGRVQTSDFDRNTVGSVISIGELATRVPVARDLTSVVLLAPGTAPGDTTFGNLPAVVGSSVSENAYYVNGLNVTDFRQGLGAGNVPFEFYNTIETKIGSIPAEFGRFTGAFINATTKAGGNEFHGGFLFNWQPDELRDDVPNTLGTFAEDNTNEVKQAIFYLSGPIIKDRLFFYGFYQSNDSQTGGTSLSIVNTGVQTVNGVRTGLPAYSLGNARTFSRNRSPFFGGKIDAIITDGHRLEGTYYNTKSVQTGLTYNVTDQSGGQYDSRVDTDILTGSLRGGSRSLLGGENYVGRYTGQFTDWLTLSAAYGKSQIRQIVGSLDDTLPAIADGSQNFYGRLLTGNPTGSITRNDDERKFYRGDVDVYVNLLGQHHFRGGYDREELTSVQENVRTGGFNYAYILAGTGDQFGVPAGTVYASRQTYRNGGTFNTLNEAAYIQDSWSGFNNRVNIQAGLRWDRFKNDNVDGVRYYDSGDNFAPRISVSFDPLGDQRAKFYGFYGRYYLPLVTNTNIRLAGSELYQTEYFNTSGPGDRNIPILTTPILAPGALRQCITTSVANCTITADGTAQDTTSTVAKDLASQSVDEYILGYEQRIGSRWKVGAFGVWRDLRNSLEDIAIDQAVNNYCASEGITGCDDIWSGFHQYVLANPGRGTAITLSDPINGESELRTVNFTAEQLGYPPAVRKYRAVTITLDREFDGVWSFSGNYTYAKNFGNIEGGVLSDIGQTDSGLTQSFDQPGLTQGIYGYLPNDVRHTFKAFGSYQVTPWFTLGANVQVYSPRKFGCYGLTPRTADPYAYVYGAAGFFCNVANGEIVTDPAFPVINDLPTRPGGPRPSTLQPNRRGTVLESDWQSSMNLSFVFKLPTDMFAGTLRFDVFNVFNEQAVIDRNEFGTNSGGVPRADFGVPTSYQTPRYVRVQFGFDF